MIHTLTHYFTNIPLLAYRPFLDPIDAHSWWWWLSIPLIFGIAVTYKAIRLPTLERYWRHVIRMCVQVFVALVVLSVALYLLVQLILPRFLSGV